MWLAVWPWASHLAAVKHVVRTGESMRIKSDWKLSPSQRQDSIVHGEQQEITLLKRAHPTGVCKAAGLRSHFPLIASPARFSCFYKWLRFSLLILFVLGSWSPVPSTVPGFWFLIHRWVIFCSTASACHQDLPLSFLTFLKKNSSVFILFHAPFSSHPIQTGLPFPQMQGNDPLLSIFLAS